MKLFITFIILISFVSKGFSQHKGNINTTSKKFARDTVIWKKDSLLTHDNFKGKVPSNGTGGTSSAIFIYPRENDPTYFYVEAIFMKSKSFLRENQPYILRHEQLHFDITELYARKLRQQMHETDFKKVKNIFPEIQRMYNKVVAEEQKEQVKYDKDTEHGLNAAKQQVWSEDIAQRLRAMEDFSETEINVVK